MRTHVLVGVIAATLMISGCSTSEHEQNRTEMDAVGASATSPTELNHAYNPKVGGRDADRLSGMLNAIDGVNLSPEKSGELARELCRMLAEGASLREGADWVVGIGGRYWGEQNARLVSLRMVLEFCPGSAEG